MAELAVVKKLTHVCGRCGRKFQADPWQAAKYCSAGCRKAASRAAIAARSAASELVTAGVEKDTQSCDVAERVASVHELEGISNSGDTVEGRRWRVRDGETDMILQCSCSMELGGWKDVWRGDEAAIRRGVAWLGLRRMQI